MIMHDCHVHSWRPPGKQWWDNVKSKPDEPLIEATIRLTLTWKEYSELLLKSGEIPNHELSPKES